MLRETLIFISEHCKAFFSYSVCALIPGEHCHVKEPIQNPLHSRPFNLCSQIYTLTSHISSCLLLSSFAFTADRAAKVAAHIPASLHWNDIVPRWVSL